MLFWFEYSSYLHDFKLFMFLSYWWNHSTVVFSCPANLQFITPLLMSKLSMTGPENSSTICHSKHLKLFIFSLRICYIYKTFFTCTQEIHLFLVLALASTGLIFAVARRGHGWEPEIVLYYLMSLPGAAGRKSFQVEVAWDGQVMVNICI